jgi:Protein of unknown function (DUF2637)/Homeodomain-like domain
VAAIAAYASYEHMRSLSLCAGQSPGIAAVLPISCDGLVVVASVALVDGRERKTSAWVAFILGVSASIVANVLAAGPTLIDRCVSAWPSVALLITIEVIARGGSRRVNVTATVPTEPTQARQVVAALPAETLPDVSASASMAADVPDVPLPAAAQAAVPARKVAAGGSKRKVTKAEKVVRALAKDPGATTADVAKRLRISESTVRRSRRAFTAGPADSESADVDDRAVAA